MKPKRWAKICRECGASLHGVHNAKKLRDIGYCKRCVPDSYLCKAKIKTGERCSRLAQKQGYCKQHYKMAGNRPLYKTGDSMSSSKYNKSLSWEESDFVTGEIAGAGTIVRYALLFGVFLKNRVEVNDYRAYIKNSPEWRTKADEIKDYFGNKCQLCNKNGILHAHHRTYKRVGEELPEDITVLCEKCHNEYETRRKKAHI